MNKTPGNKVNLINFLVVFFTVILSSRASSLARNDVFLLVITLLVFIYFIVKRKKITKEFLWVVLFLVGYLYLEMILYGIPNLSAYLRIFTRLLLVYCAFKISKDYWYYFEKIVFFLTFLSLILFPIQLIARDLLISLMSPLSSIINSGLESNSEYSTISAIVFTIHHTSFKEGYMIRNSGFMWEPGAFAAIIIISMVIYYLRNGFRNKFRYIVYYIALISTFSTMGYVVLLIFTYTIMYHSYNKRPGLLIIMFPLLLGVTIYIIGLPFMQAKVEDQMEGYDEAFSSTNTNRDIKSLGRFGSLYGGLISLKENPLTGIGLDDSRRLSGRFVQYNWSNGIVEYTLKFGLIGLVFFIYNIHKSLKQQNLARHRKLTITSFVLIVLITLFSNPLSIFPVFIALQFSYLFKYKPLYYQTQKLAADPLN